MVLLKTSSSPSCNLPRSSHDTRVSSKLLRSNLLSHSTALISLVSALLPSSLFVSLSKFHTVFSNTSAGDELLYFGHRACTLPLGSLTLTCVSVCVWLSVVMWPCSCSLPPHANGRGSRVGTSPDLDADFASSKIRTRATSSDLHPVVASRTIGRLEVKCGKDASEDRGKPSFVTHLMSARPPWLDSLRWTAYSSGRRSRCGGGSREASRR